MYEHARAPMHARARLQTQKYIIFIAFPRKQWFRERGSVLRLLVVGNKHQVKLLSVVMLL